MDVRKTIARRMIKPQRGHPLAEPVSLSEQAVSMPDG
jgi:hypothetical protein